MSQHFKTRICITAILLTNRWERNADDVNSISDKMNFLCSFFYPVPLCFTSLKIILKSINGNME